MFVLFGFSICIMIWNPTASASTIFLWNQTVFQFSKEWSLNSCHSCDGGSAEKLQWPQSQSLQIILWGMSLVRLSCYSGTWGGFMWVRVFFSFCRFFLMIAVPSEKHWFDTLNIKAFANRAHTEVLLILHSWNTTWRDHLLRDEDNSVSKAAQGLALSN